MRVFKVRRDSERANPVGWVDTKASMYCSAVCFH